jgi:hypothetical protein
LKSGFVPTLHINITCDGGSTTRRLFTNVTMLIISNIRVAFSRVQAMVVNYTLHKEAVYHLILILQTNLKGIIHVTPIASGIALLTRTIHYLLHRQGYKLACEQLQFEQLRLVVMKELTILSHTL